MEQSFRTGRGHRSSPWDLVSNGRIHASLRRGCASMYIPRHVGRRKTLWRCGWSHTTALPSLTHALTAIAGSLPNLIKYSWNMRPCFPIPSALHLRKGCSIFFCHRICYASPWRKWPNGFSRSVRRLKKKARQLWAVTSGHFGVSLWSSSQSPRLAALATVMICEVGDINRFKTPGKFVLSAKSYLADRFESHLVWSNPLRVLLIPQITRKSSTDSHQCACNKRENRFYKHTPPKRPVLRFCPVCDSQGAR